MHVARYRCVLPPMRYLEDAMTSVSNKVKLTIGAVAKVQPGIRDLWLWDTEIKGFGLKVTPKGNAAFTSTTGRNRMFSVDA